MRSSRRNDVLLVAFLVFAAACLILMWAVPDQETVPYHVIFLTLTLLYGFTLWPPRRTLLLLLVVTVSTGFILVALATAGEIEWEETTEIVLMPAIFLGMLWHSHRQLQARERAQTEANEQRELLDHERQFIQDTSHAIRTPVTVARGHVDLLAAQITDEQSREDLAVIADQLDRIAHLAATLMAIKELDHHGAERRELLDVADLAAGIARRWTKAVPRRWDLVTPPGAIAVVDEHSIELALNALIENAIKHTGQDDTVRLRVTREATSVTIHVEDSGPGIPVAERALVFDRFWKGSGPKAVQGTGLGLALVRAVARSHDGTAQAGESSLGGADVSLSLPGTVIPSISSMTSGDDVIGLV
jgi:signal transduction histidine kinase